MKKILLLLSIFLVLMANGQRMKYSELAPLLNSMSDEEARNELKEYMMYDNAEPNTYFRLALIYERTYKNADPLTEYRLAMANAAEASSRFMQCTIFVNEKEVNRNNEYYYPFFPNSFDSKGKPSVEFGKVSAKSKAGLDSANLFKQKIPAIYYQFTHSVNSYDKAVKLFAAISDQYESIEDLYLLYDADLQSRLAQLKMNYDSSILYFNQYQTLIKEYPIKSHKQTYKVKPVETFRLDGLITGLNFLTDKIEFWNYAAWVGGVNQHHNTVITELRSKLTDAETHLQESIVKASSSETGFAPYKLNKQLVLDLNNVDKESAVLALLQYQGYIQNWLHQTKFFKADTANQDRNAVAYSDFIHQNRHADTLVREISSRITDLKISMHKDFIAKYFGGKAALEKYVSDEQTMIGQSYQELASKLRSSILHKPDSSWLLKNKENQVKFNSKNIPLKLLPVKMEDLDKGLLFTQFNRKNPDGSAYIAGIYKPDKKINNSVIFVARTLNDGKVVWFNSFNPKIDTISAQPDANQILGPIVATPEGIAFIVRSEHLTDGRKQNSFFYLSEAKGDVKVKFTLADNTYPRFLTYMEKQNAFVFLLKGNEAALNFTLKEDVTITCINVLKDLMWKKVVPLTGSITDISHTSDGLLLAGNFMTINDNRGVEVRTKINAKESNPFMIKVSEKGEVMSIPISVPLSFYLQKMLHVSDQSINLIGTKDTFETGPTKIFDYTAPALHLMVTKSGQIVYSNF